MTVIVLVRIPLDAGYGHPAGPIYNTFFPNLGFSSLGLRVSSASDLQAFSPGCLAEKVTLMLRPWAADRPDGGK